MLSGHATEGATTAGRADPHNSFNLDPGLPAAATRRTAPNDPFFDASATFAGAMGAVDWTAGWTKYPQN